MTQNDSAQRGQTDKIPNINDLSDDCLVKIMTMLDLTNLINAAETNKRWNKLASSLFVQNYGWKTIEVDRMIFKNFRDQRHAIEDDKIIISKPSTFVAILRVFGKQITKLQIDFECIDPFHCKKIEKFINQFCAGTLLELHLKNCRETDMVNYSKPFKMVEFVSIVGGHLGKSLAQFNKLFPQMQRLELSNNDISNRACIEMNFPHLYDLTIDVENRAKVGFRMLNVTKALRANPQIRFLILQSNFNQSLVSIVDTLLPDLNSFELQPQATFFTGQKGSVVNISNIKRLKLSVPDLSQHLSMHIPFAFMNLLELNLCIGGYIDQFFNFVCETKTLRKVHMQWIHKTAYGIIDEPIAGVLDLPDIVELDLVDFIVQAKKKVIRSIIGSKSLIDFRMKFCSESQWSAWSDGVDCDAWTVTGDNLNIHFRRKILFK